MDRTESTSFEFRSHTVSHNPHRAGASTSEHTATPRGKQTRSLGEAEAVLRLRALRASGDFDAYCKLHLDRERREASSRQSVP